MEKFAGRFFTFTLGCGASVLPDVCACVCVWCEGDPTCSHIRTNVQVLTALVCVSLYVYFMHCDYWCVRCVCVCMYKSVYVCVLHVCTYSTYSDR